MRSEKAGLIREHILPVEQRPHLPHRLVAHPVTTPPRSSNTRVDSGPPAYQSSFVSGSFPPTGQRSPLLGVDVGHDLARGLFVREVIYP